MKAVFAAVMATLVALAPALAFAAEASEQSPLAKSAEKFAPIFILLVVIGLALDEHGADGLAVFILERRAGADAGPAPPHATHGAQSHSSRRRVALRDQVRRVPRLGQYRVHRPAEKPRRD